MSAPDGPDDTSSTAPPELREPRGEVRVLPSERGPRKPRISWRRMLVFSLLAHVAAVVLLVAFLRFIGLPMYSSLPDEYMPVTFTEQLVHRKAPEPPATNVIGTEDAVADSPGNEPVPEGSGVPDRTQEMPQGTRDKPPEPAPQEQEQPTPEQQTASPEPSNQPSRPEDRARRVAEALRGLGGGPGSSWGDLAGAPSTGLTMGHGSADFQIESKADVDWGPWGAKVRSMVKANWYAIMPTAAEIGMKGVVQVRFVVLRDGTIEIENFEILERTDVPPLDSAVSDALLRMSNPLPPLPLAPDEIEDTIRITYTFIYNLHDDREVRQWQRERWRVRRSQPG